MPLRLVLGLLPGANAEQDLGHAQRPLDGHAVDRDQNVAGAKTGPRGGTFGIHAPRLDAEVRVHPGDAIVGQLELALLLKVQQAGQDRPDGQDRQENPREAKLAVAEHPTPFRRGALHAEGHMGRVYLVANCFHASHLPRSFRRAGADYSFWKILYKNSDCPSGHTSSLLDVPST